MNDSPTLTPSPLTPSTLAAPNVVRPLRRDAAENRQHLLDAAAEVFAQRGLEAGVEEIARVAGVGVGTLYRRFPTKEALIDTLVLDVLETMVRSATEALELPDGTGLEHYLEAASDCQARNRGCLPKLWTTDTNHELILALRHQIGLLLDDAKRHGKVRADLELTDLTMVKWSIRGVIETTREVAPNAWRRHLEILIAGLRPTGQPLTEPAISRAELDRVVRAT